MSFWGKVFGTEKALESTIEHVSKGIDALVYTEEERAVSAAEARSEARSMVVEWMKNTQGQNLARRGIALSITTVWLAQYLVSWVMSLCAVFLDEYHDDLIRAAEVTTSQAESMVGAVMLILSFYFAAPHMEKVVGAAMSRFSK